MLSNMELFKINENTWKYVYTTTGLQEPIQNIAPNTKFVLQVILSEGAIVKNILAKIDKDQTDFGSLDGENLININYSFIRNVDIGGSIQSLQFDIESLGNSNEIIVIKKNI